MPRSPHQLLTAAAARPSEDVDVDAVRRRGLRLRRRRRLAAGVVTAGVLTVAVAVPVGLRQPSSTIDLVPSPDTDPPPGSSADDPPEDDPPEQAAAVTLGAWERVGADSLGVEGVFEGLSGGTVTDDGAIVAVGTSQRPDGRQHGAVWRAEELRAWTRVDADAFAGDADAQPNAAATVEGSQVVAVGAVGPQQAAPGPAGRRIDPDFSELTATVWRSPDGGRTWQAVPADKVEAADGAQMVDVAAGPHGLLAVGVAAEEGATRPLMWQAPAAGADWRVQPTGLPAERGTTYGPLASDGERYLLAVDTPPPNEGPERETSNPDIDVTLWQSSDGQSWQPVADPDGALAGPGRQRVSDLLVVDGHFLAIGRENSDTRPQGTDVAWSSPEGQRWRRAADGLDVPSAATDFVTTDGHLVALTIVTSYATEVLTEADPAVWAAPITLTSDDPGSG